MTNEEPLYVVFSMDCLPAGGREEVHGPDRWDKGAGAPLAFAQALDQEGYRATYFIAPEAANRLKDVADELADADCELGVLCHPQLSGYQSYLGSYSYDRQREIVSLARKVWTDELSRPAAAFRSGFFSANDYTFHVLCMEGFQQGSCSLPGRMDNDQCSMWFRSYPFPHHTDPLDRTSAGTMEYLEVPVTSDYEAAAYVSYETYTPPHLRIEEPDVHDYARDLIEAQLDRMEEEDAEPRVIHFITSNVTEWTNTETPYLERLHNLCSTLREVADRREMKVRWTGLEALHRQMDQLLGVAREEDLGAG
ncbi:MAG: hypothetical protein R6X33_01330 [Candidatus Brocadiia bacterium]